MVEVQESLDTYEELKSSGQLGLIYNSQILDLLLYNQLLVLEVCPF